MQMRVEQAGDKLEEEGREYQLVLRGDPVSGTSLLSTTIQTAMLLGRVLDPLQNPVTDGVYAGPEALLTPHH